MTRRDTAIAAVLVDLAEPLELAELEIPDLEPGQVLVDIAFSGVCQTQLHEVRGHRGPDAFLPHTLGHEGSGVVREVGKGVTKALPGDHVILSWIKGSGAEVPSTTYQSMRLGRVNSGAISTFMTKSIASENRVTPISKSLPLDVAALLGCAVPTGAGSVLRTANAQTGESVAVFGLGGVGLSALMGAEQLRCDPIIAIDISADKLKIARTLGATHTVNAAEEDSVEGVRAATAGKGVDVAIEASGDGRAMEAAYRSVRVGGGRAVIGGNLVRGERISIDPFDLILGRRLLGSWGGDTVPDEDLPRYAKAFLKGSMRLRELISHVFTLDRVNDALDQLEQGRVLRALIDLHHK